jgi:hypothetical protein
MKDVTTRAVVILGRRPSVRWDRVRDKLQEGQDLVVLSVGYPVTRAQRQALLRLQDLAAEVGALLDAQLVTSLRELLGALEPDDSVLVAARGRLERTLREALPAASRSR